MDKFFEYLFLTFIVGTLAFAVGSCTKDKIQIRSLKNEIDLLNKEKPELWVRSCLRAVEMSCEMTECSIIPIEKMQEKICRLQEEE